MGHAAKRQAKLSTKGHVEGNNVLVAGISHIGCHRPDNVHDNPLGSRI